MGKQVLLYSEMRKTRPPRAIFKNIYNEGEEHALNNIIAESDLNNTPPSPHPPQRIPVFIIAFGGPTERLLFITSLVLTPALAGWRGRLCGGAAMATRRRHGRVSQRSSPSMACSKRKVISCLVHPCYASKKGHQLSRPSMSCSPPNGHQLSRRSSACSPQKQISRLACPSNRRPSPAYAGKQSE
jgi:hypothetical protein